MEIVYREQCETTREYRIDVNVEDFLEWLGDEKPTEELLNEFLISEYLSWEDPYEDEHVITSGVENDTAFIEMCEEYLEDADSNE